MRVSVNGEPRDLPSGATVADVIADVVTSDAGVAVAVNDEVVPRSAWRATQLQPGDRVELLSAVPGG